MNLYVISYKHFVRVGKGEPVVGLYNDGQDVFWEPPQILNAASAKQAISIS
jgi:hypothetical protein